MSKQKKPIQDTKNINSSHFCITESIHYSSNVSKLDAKTKEANSRKNITFFTFCTIESIYHSSNDSKLESQYPFYMNQVKQKTLHGCRSNKEHPNGQMALTSKLLFMIHLLLKFETTVTINFCQILKVKSHVNN